MDILELDSCLFCLFCLLGIHVYLFIPILFVPNEVQPGASPAKVSMDATAQERGNKEKGNKEKRKEKKSRKYGKKGFKLRTTLLDFLRIVHLGSVVPEKYCTWILMDLMDPGTKISSLAVKISENQLKITNKIHKLLYNTLSVCGTWG